MKIRIFLFAFVCLFSGVARAQTLLPGALLPALPQQFLNANGAPAANGRLCTQASGTNTALAVYSDPQLTMPLPNPIKLNAAGIATTNGTTETAVYTSAASYRVTLYGPGNGGIATCNGQAVGALIWQFDNIYDFGQINSNGSGSGGGGSAHPCMTGADMAAKITAAYSTLPSSGGIIDCSNLTTPQSLGTDPFTGMTTPTTVIFPVVTSTSTVALNVPPNVTLLFPQGGILANANTTKIAGRIDAGNWQIFAGSGTVCFGVSTVCNISYGFTKTAIPEWWGASGNATILGTETASTGCSGTGGSAIISCAAAAFTSADVGKIFDLSHAGPSNCGQQYFNITSSTFNCNLIGTIASVGSSTSITLSTNLNNSVSGEQFAYGTPDNSSIISVIKSGVANIGLSRSYAIDPRANTMLFVLNNVTFHSPGPGVGRLVSIGTQAYASGLNKNNLFAIDNGSNNITFDGVGFIGTNEIGELNTFGATPDGLVLCSGVPSTFGCGPGSGISNIRILNCDFSYFWGIGLHAFGTGTTVGQQINDLYVVNSKAQWNSYDGFNLNIFTGLVMNNDIAKFNGTGGVETAPVGGITITGSIFDNNKLVGVSLGGFTTLQFSASSQIAGNDISNNGNLHTGAGGNTDGYGIIIASGTQNVTITGNTLRHNNVYGIWFDQDTGFTYKNISINGNVITSNGLNSGAISGAGIYGQPSGTIISDNEIIDEATNQINTAQLTSNVVTITTLTTHNYLVGDSVSINGSGNGGYYDGSFTILSTPTGNTFTYAKTAANHGPDSGGLAYDSSIGFTQLVGIDITAAYNSQILNNHIINNRNKNIFVESGSNYFVSVLATNSNLPIGNWNGATNDMVINITPSIAGLAVRMPDVMTTVANVCSTSGSLAATCTSVITHNLGVTPNFTTCSLDNAPNAQSGIPLIVKTDTSTSANTATITISAQTAAVAGNGTMRCRTNYAY